MFDGAAETVMQGINITGEKFRPSEWSERLCGMMSVFGEDRQLSYSPYTLSSILYLRPVIAAGMSCVVVDRKLDSLDAAALKFLLLFARHNES